MHASWQPPQNYRSRPVTVIGAGVLGRRIGMFHHKVYDQSPNTHADQDVSGHLPGTTYESETPVPSSEQRASHTSRKMPQPTLRAPDEHQARLKDWRV